MVCLLQPECNFLHGFFWCKHPIEVVDVEVKITSMQGTYIFRRDQTMQVIKCTPCNTRLCPHPTIIKKMKTFLEVEGKMGPTPAPASQFRPPLPNTNPNIRKDNTAEKRKRAVSNRFRPATPKPTTACQPLPEAPPKPKNNVPDNQPPPSVPVCKSTPWSGTGKMPGNLFKDRNWMLLLNYLSNDHENKTESEPMNTESVTSPRPLIKKRGIQGKQPRKMQLGTRLPFLQILEERGREQATAAEDIGKNTKTTDQKTRYFESKHEKSQIAMGSRNGET